MMLIPPEIFNPVVHELPIARDELYAHDYVTVVEAFDGAGRDYGFWVCITPPFMMDSGQVQVNTPQGNAAHVYRNGQLVVRMKNPLI